MVKCYRTRKVCFRNELYAKIALAKLQWKDTGQKRVYRCEHCKQWHLTSQERRAGR